MYVLIYFYDVVMIFMELVSLDGMNREREKERVTALRTNTAPSLYGCPHSADFRPTLDIGFRPNTT